MKIEYLLAQQSLQEIPIEQTETDKVIFLVTFTFMILFFFIVGAISEKYKPKIGHETTYTVLLGLLISLILWFGDGGPKGAEKLAATFTFKSTFFMDFILPPLVFNAGYTMRKKKFFDNLGNITMNGLFVTVLCFVIYGFGTIALV